MCVVVEAGLGRSRSMELASSISSTLPWIPSPRPECRRAGAWPDREATQPCCLEDSWALRRYPYHPRAAWLRGSHGRPTILDKRSADPVAGLPCHSRFGPRSGGARDRGTAAAQVYRIDPCRFVVAHRPWLRCCSDSQLPSSSGGDRTSARNQSCPRTWLRAPWPGWAR